MHKVFVFLAVILFLFTTTPVFAHSGCCSSHLGVRSDGCGCNDGTPLSYTCAPYYTCTANTYTAPVQQTVQVIPSNTPLPTSVQAVPTFTPTPSPKPKPTIKPKHVVKKTVKKKHHKPTLTPTPRSFWSFFGF